LLDAAFSLAVSAHGEDRRPSDGRLFVEHVTEVAALLHRLGFDEELVATCLLHDSIERGQLSESELRSTMGDSICDLVVALSENPSIEQLKRRKSALREQVSRGGVRAVTVFAADKLSDIAGLRRQLENSRQGAQARSTASAATLASHYRDSVQISQPCGQALSSCWRYVVSFGDSRPSLS